MEPTVIYEMACQCGAVFSGLEELRRHRERPWYIYGLFSDAAEDDRIRYIGKTQRTPGERFRGHLKGSIKERTHLGAWLRKLRALGQTPELIVLETGVGHGVDDAERWYINWLAYSSQLTNHTAGGEGLVLLEGPAGELTREKLRNTAKSGKYAERLKKANRNSPACREHLKRLHANPEYRRKNSEQLRQLHADPEFQRKRNERLRKLNADPEFRKKNAERLRAMHADPAYRQKHLERLQRLNAQRRAKSRSSKGETP